MALTGQKYKRCDTVSNYSCVKNLKIIKILNSEELICCDKTFLEDDTDFYDPIDDV